MLNRIVNLEVDDLNIAGQLYLPDGNHPFPAVCLCHGIPTGKPDPDDKDYSPLAKRLRHQGFAAFFFNFRGDGPSSGNFDILGWTRDLKAAIDYLCALPEVDESRLSLLGFSAGAAVSVYVAAQDERVSSIATCACPAEFTFFRKDDDLPSIIEHFRRIGIIRDKAFPHSTEEWIDSFRQVSPIKHIAEIAPRPLLLVHGSKDELVAVSHARRLYGKAGEPKQLIVVDSAEHGLRQNDTAMDIVIDWLKSRSRVNG